MPLVTGERSGHGFCNRHSMFKGRLHGVKGFCKELYNEVIEVAAHCSIGVKALWGKRALVESEGSWPEQNVVKSLTSKLKHGKANRKEGARKAKNSIV